MKPSIPHTLMLTGSSWGWGRTRLTWTGFNWQSSFNTSADGSWYSDTLRLLFYCLQKLFQFNTGSTLTHPCLTDQSGTRFTLFLHSSVICYRQTQMRMAFADPGAQQFKSLEIFAKPGSVAGSDWPDPTFTQASLTSAPETRSRL